MKTNFYQAKFVPARIPDFVDSHITICPDPITGERIFLFEVSNPDQYDFDIIFALSNFGFKGVKLITEYDAAQFSMNGFDFDYGYSL